MLLWISAAAAVLYSAAFSWRDDDSALRSVVKVVPLAALALHAALTGSPGLLVAALGLSAIGDLALSRAGNTAFLSGLVAFAAAHLAYIAILWPIFTAPAPGVVFAIVLLALSTRWWLLPHTGDMRLAVIVYVVIIATMALCATGHPLAIVTLGALLFLASDALLAVKLFRLPEGSRWQVPTGVILWALYYIGQYLLWRGLSA